MSASPRLLGKLAETFEKETEGFAPWFAETLRTFARLQQASASLAEELRRIDARIAAGVGTSELVVLRRRRRYLEKARLLAELSQSHVGRALAEDS